MAGYLEQRCGVRKGDRVLLLHAEQPAIRDRLLRHPARQCGRGAAQSHELTQEIAAVRARTRERRTVIVSQELYSARRAAARKLATSSGDRGRLLRTICKQPTDLAGARLRARAARLSSSRPGVTLWRDVLASGLQPGPLTAGPDDLCVMPYTSGTTGKPKGCMHTHRSTMHTTGGAACSWFAYAAGD